MQWSSHACQTTYAVGEKGGGVGGVDHMVGQDLADQVGAGEQLLHSQASGLEGVGKGHVGGGQQHVAGAVEGVVQLGGIQEVTQDGKVESISHLANGELVAGLGVEDGRLTGGHGHEACVKVINQLPRCQIHRTNDRIRANTPSVMGSGANNTFTMVCGERAAMARVRLQPSIARQRHAPPRGRNKHGHDQCNMQCRLFRQECKQADGQRAGNAPTACLNMRLHGKQRKATAPTARTGHEGHKQRRPGVHGV